MRLLVGHTDQSLSFQIVWNYLLHLVLCMISFKVHVFSLLFSRSLSLSCFGSFVRH